jgi:hypothetical protein
MFSQARYDALRTPAILAGVLLVLVVTAMLIWRRQSVQMAVSILHIPGRFRRDALQMWRDFWSQRLDRRETIALVLVTLLALAARVAFVMRPLEHDEAYTVSVFASEPLRYALADYHLPNNHLFHTIWVRLAVLIFGYQPWAVRLPALLAGVAVVPLLYLLARRFYDRRVALISATSAAVLPILVYFGTNARGYTLVMMFTLIALLLATYVRRQANLAAWSLLAIVCTLGFFTIPVFLFPFGMVMLWLLLAVRVKEPGSDYLSLGRFIAWMAGTGAATAFLTVLAYLPVFLTYGVQAVVAEEVKYPAGWGIFIQNVHARLQETWTQWTSEIPGWAAVLLVIGVLLSVLLVRRPPARQVSRLPLQFAAVAWTGFLVVVLRSPPWQRFLVFLVPLFLLWGAAGWVTLLAFAQERLHLCRDLASAFAGLVVLAALAGTLVRVVTLPQARFSYQGEVEQAALFLQDQLQPQDLIVATSPQDAVLWYYSRLHQIDMQHFKRELPFFRTFVLVDPAASQSLSSVMEERGPDPFFFQLDQARLVYQAGSLQVLELIPDADLIRHAYHLP